MLHIYSKLCVAYSGPSKSESSQVNKGEVYTLLTMRLVLGWTTSSMLNKPTTPMHTIDWSLTLSVLNKQIYQISLVWPAGEEATEFPVTFCTCLTLTLCGWNHWMSLNTEKARDTLQSTTWVHDLECLIRSKAARLQPEDVQDIFNALKPKTITHQPWPCSTTDGVRTACDWGWEERDRTTQKR